MRRAEISARRLVEQCVGRIAESAIRHLFFTAAVMLR
jgi:hypothetical protein